VTQKGPLCNEMIRGVIFWLVLFVNDGKQDAISITHMTSILKKTFFSVLIAASPWLMELIYFVEV
jgi:hypothetical protein